MRTLPILAASVAAAGILAVGCTPRTATAPPEKTSEATEPATPAPGIVDGPTAQRLVAEGARLLDVRTPQEYAEGHPPGAVNVPYEVVGQRAAELGGPETPIVVYCRSGRRSAIAVEALKGLGYRRVYDLQRVTSWPQDVTPAPSAR
jgi:phage shock protein E